MATWYAALLRGINVGGKNIVPMADLRACFADIGAREVATYIQSGNVVFDGGDRGAADWTERIEMGLTRRFSYDARIVLRRHDEVRAAVHRAPSGFGADPDRYRSDVLFLRGPASAVEVVSQLTPRDGVDQVAAGDGVVYFERLIARATQSRMSKVVGLPIYQQMTIRNWRTTTTLLAMLDERAD